MTFSLLALTIFVASIQVSPAPTPAPSLPPEIIHTITSESCTTLQKLMLPVGYASKSTDEAFTSMSAQVKAYNDHFLVGEDPNIERPTTNGGTQTGVTGKSVPPRRPEHGFLGRHANGRRATRRFGNV